VTDGEIYLKTRKNLGLSRADVSAMAKRAGHSISQSTIDRLEHKGSGAIGRGLSHGALGWLEYVYGIADRAGVVKWAGVERGAPVVVHHEKGAWQFHAADGDDITVFGGRRNDCHFRTFPESQVRLIALTALPPPETAPVFESRYKGSDSAYATRILTHMRKTPGAHSVGAMAWTLGMHNAVVSRVAADLAKKGTLIKLQRGVFILPEEVAGPDVAPVAADETPGPVTLEEFLETGDGPDVEWPDRDEEVEEAVSVKSALAERVRVPGRD
jgi:hypothetical protein